MRRPPRSTLFPYTTLFRSALAAEDVADVLAKSAGYLPADVVLGDRKSTRLNSSHVASSYAVFCLKKKRPHRRRPRAGREHRGRRRGEACRAPASGTARESW